MQCRTSCRARSLVSRCTLCSATFKENACVRARVGLQIGRDFLWDKSQFGGIRAALYAVGKGKGWQFHSSFASSALLPCRISSSLVPPVRSARLLESDLWTAIARPKTDHPDTKRKARAVLGQPSARPSSLAECASRHRSALLIFSYTTILLRRLLSCCKRS
jgi:hypothetical protein